VVTYHSQSHQAWLDPTTISVTNLCSPFKESEEESHDHQAGPITTGSVAQHQNTLGLTGSIVPTQVTIKPPRNLAIGTRWMRRFTGTYFSRIARSLTSPRRIPMYKIVPSSAYCCPTRLLSLRIPMIDDDARVPKVRLSSQNTPLSTTISTSMSYNLQVWKK